MFRAVTRVARFCALIAVLLILTVAGGGAVGPTHLDCADDGAACSCVCHDNAAIQASDNPSFSAAVADAIECEPRLYSSLIPADIFRPPAA